MQTVIKNMPLNNSTLGHWTCGCAHDNHRGIMPHYCPAHRLPPVIELRDEASGIANLEAAVPTARTPLVVGLVIVAAAFCAGVAAGALITEILFKH